MPKKQQHNEFYFFMLDKKPEVEKRLGRTVGMGELPQHIFQEWKMLSEAKKEKYKKMKNQHRECEEKLDCRGVPIREIQEREEQHKLRGIEMRKEIETTIDALKHGNALEKGKFFLVCTNAYIATEESLERIYVPAEISVLEFTLENGIMEEHHVILPPNNIPMGYGYEAQVHCEKTHNLMDENNPKNASFPDKDVGWNIMEFIARAGQIEEGQRLPPLYTLEGLMEQTIGIFNGLLPDDDLHIYSLEELFQNIYSAVLPDLAIPKTISHDMLTHCGLDFHPTIACEWHIQYQSDAGKYCTLGCVRRWVFHICDNLKLEETFQIEPEEGKHLPRAQTNTGTVVDIPRPSQQYEYMSRSSSRNVSQTSSTRDVFVFTQEKKVLDEIKPAPIPAVSAWGRSATSHGSKTSSSYGTAAGAVANSKPDTDCDDQFPALGVNPTRGRGKNRRGNK